MVDDDKLKTLRFRYELCLAAQDADGAAEIAADIDEREGQLLNEVLAQLNALGDKLEKGAQDAD